MSDAASLVVYWPAGAVLGATLAVIAALTFIASRIAKLKAALDAIARSRRELNEARPLARESIGKVKVRRQEMKAMHKSAARLFWRSEKTWIG